MGKKSTEILTHFQCSECNRWWSIGDCDQDRKEWFCPWCGFKQMFKETGGNKKPEEKKTTRL